MTDVAQCFPSLAVLYKTAQCLVADCSAPAHCLAEHCELLQLQTRKKFENRVEAVPAVIGINIAKRYGKRECITPDTHMAYLGEGGGRDDSQLVEHGVYVVKTKEDLAQPRFADFEPNSAAGPQKCKTIERRSEDVVPVTAEGESRGREEQKIDVIADFLGHCSEEETCILRVDLSGCCP